MNKRCVILLTGKPAAGKTTLANALAYRFNSVSSQFLEHPWRVVDADDIRRQFWPHLGHSTEDRMANLAGLVHVAKGVLTARNNVLLCCVSPFSEMRREMLRSLSWAGGLLLDPVDNFITPYTFTFWVDAALPVLRERDPKGLYRLQEQGKLKGLTGVDAVYQVPVETEEPYLLVRTDHAPLDACVEDCYRYLNTRMQQSLHEHHELTETTTF